MIEIKIYRTKQGYEPFSDWLVNLRDKLSQKIIQNRIERIKIGNFGDYKNVGEGVFELRFFIGSGYRVYFGKEHNKLILLLCAGDKSTQQKDIKKAKIYWQDYKEHENE